MIKVHWSRDAYIWVNNVKVILPMENIIWGSVRKKSKIYILKIQKFINSSTHQQQDELTETPTS